MAEKKKTQPIKETEKEKVYIPPEGRGDTQRFISVNGRRLLVQTGKELFLPKMYAEVIKNSQAQDREAQAYIDAMATD